ncbi:sialate O-acetylesterase [Winogradskyella eximia]|uniref:sialate O-acetylesterase n=1 Tax=Winogradskyella eximia TaxID=262006 RepID=UPI002490CB30|nr:sialate O-acetylesterase [Winogradskyella eximia]
MKTKTVCLFIFLTFYSIFSGAQNKLNVDAIFSSQMVLQRHHKIPVWGTAKPNIEITVTLKDVTITTLSNSQGRWNVNFEALEAGGPYRLNIVSTDESIQLTDILIGDVWLASGQSNMHLDLKRTLNGDSIAKKANNPNLRIFNMKPTYPTGKEGVHTLEELKKIQNNQYFNTKGWVKATPEEVLYFSAVGYYFAEKLQSELNIPIGIIHNAVPGSPIESWLSKKEIQQDSTISNFVKQRWKAKAEEKDAMISVAKHQISLSEDVNQKHPWMPSYNYENGILPIKNVPIKGVIWYQGESNAEAPVLYQSMFKKMVKLWRTDFNADVPFYFTQLTSREDRPAWPEFRYAQSESLNEVANTKMAVISDVGDRQDTHAKNKQPVGERLALLALGDTYKVIKDYESPVFDKTTFSNHTYTLHFKGEFSGLKTPPSQDIIGFEISTDNIHFEKLEPHIEGKTITFSLANKHKKPFYIRYAWKPYTEANLTSIKGLPVSTFRAKID